MKKLIYFTVGNNPNYIKLTKLCVETLYKFGYDGDLLFITDLKTTIEKEITFNSDVYFLETNKSNLLTSSANKLKIYLFDKINDYDKIIYCDSDVLWLDNPNKIFDLISEDKIYISNETPLMSSGLWWGGAILTSEEKYDISKNNIKAMNAGFFGFNKNMIHHFEKIDDFFISNPRYYNTCLEQPFLNVYIYRNNIYDNSLSDIVTEKGCELEKYDGVVLHFAGGPGDFLTKYNKMINYYEKNIK